MSSKTKDELENEAAAKVAAEIKKTAAAEVEVRNQRTYLEWLVSPTPDFSRVLF